MRYRFDGKTVRVEDGEKVLVEARAADRKEADDLRRTALRDGPEAISAKGLAEAKKAAEAKENARIERGRAASAPKVAPAKAAAKAQAKAEPKARPKAAKK
jgi:hypothetical protein